MVPEAAPRYRTLAPGLMWIFSTPPRMAAASLERNGFQTRYSTFSPCTPSLGGNYTKEKKNYVKPPWSLGEPKRATLVISLLYRGMLRKFAKGEGDKSRSLDSLGGGGGGGGRRRCIMRHALHMLRGSGGMPPPPPPPRKILNFRSLLVHFIVNVHNL